MIGAEHIASGPTSLRAKHYAGGARYALAQAKIFRDLALNGGAAIDRHLMRGFALAWRHFTTRAREVSAGLPS